MSATIYLKRYQWSGIYNYAKLLPDRVPPLCEMINFLNPVPFIEHREYDLAIASDQTEYEALLEAWEWISEAEFTRAYNRATARDFRIYINGKAI